MSMNFAQSRLVWLLFAIALGGCAGATVSNQTQSLPITNTPPSQIVVYPFATNPSEVTLNQGMFQRAYSSMSGENTGGQQQQIADDAAQNVCLEVVSALNQKGYKAVCQQRGVPPADANALVVDGQFTDISEGNRLRRLVIGFGAGASTLDANVYVYQTTSAVGRHEVLSFTTHADSGKMPGVIATGPAGAAAGGSTAAATLGANVAMGGVKTYRSSTGFLGDKTAEQVVETLQNYFTQQGWPA